MPEGQQAGCLGNLLPSNLDCSSSINLSDRITSINQLPHKRALARSKAIDQRLSQEHEQRRRELHLLVIGGAGAGKSTFLKQFRIHHGDGFPLEERVKAVAPVLENLADAIHIVMDNMRRWGLSFKDHYVQGLASDFRNRCPRTIHFLGNMISLREDEEEDQQNFGGATPVSDHPDDNLEDVDDFEDNSMDDEEEQSTLDPMIESRVIKIRKYVRHMKNIMEQAEFSECLDCKAFFNPPITYAELYFLQHVDRVIQVDYVPTLQDILAIRKPTFAVREALFLLRGTSLRLIDLAGQKSHRNKWIHYFEGVNAVLYFWALTDYAELLEEDSLTNKMADSLQTFSEVINNKYLWHKDFVLFANKSDLFQEKLEQFSIKVPFSDYEGSLTDHEAAIAFLQSKYLNSIEDQRSKQSRIYTHVTCALDVDAMKTVIKDSLHNILDTNIKKINII